MSRHSQYGGNWLVISANSIFQAISITPDNNSDFVNARTIETLSKSKTIISSMLDAPGLGWMDESYIELRLFINMIKVVIIVQRVNQEHYRQSSTSPGIQETVRVNNSDLALYSISSLDCQQGDSIVINRESKLVGIVAYSNIALFSLYVLLSTTMLSKGETSGLLQAIGTASCISRSLLCKQILVCWCHSLRN